MEDNPNEVFMHGSIDRCWQMVQERINIMIQLHQSLGKMGLPRIRPPEDIRGLELFGFTSPHIIKVCPFFFQNVIMDVMTSLICASLEVLAR